MTTAFGKVLWRLAVATLVLATGAGIYWQETGISRLRKTRVELAVRTDSPDILRDDGSLTRTKRSRVRADPSESARRLSEDLIRHSESGRNTPGDWAEETSLMDRLNGMSASQILEMIAHLEAATSMPVATRFALIFDCLSILSYDFPDQALSIAGGS